MIRVCNQSDYEDIIRIWNNAFGDTEEYILKFLDKFAQFVYILDNVAVMTLFPVTLNDKKGHYIYAVAVDERSRKQGYGKKLINFAKEIKEDFLVLVPADRGLFEYYKKLGFCDNSNIGEYEMKTLEEKISAREYYELRDRFFDGKNYIKWSEDILFNIAELYKAEFYKAKDSIAMLAKNRVLEYLGKDAPISQKPFSMILPKDFKNSYFSIAID